jgi:two-component system, OmpR family, osmolarity sensor histidine kinase EnvZ
MARARSLFVRLLLAQVLLAIVLTGVLATLFYNERNRTVAQLVAARWVPALQRLVRGDGMAAAQAAAPTPLYRAGERPLRAFDIAELTPRVTMLREALADAGVPVRSAMLGPPATAGSTVPTVWLALDSSAADVPPWLGFESDLVETRLRERVVFAVVLLFALAVLASALIARRLARPLEALRARIAADDAAGGPLPHASAEVAAIDEAWRELRGSLGRQERERALLLAGVSHDLRSPLGRIRMAAELLPDAPGVAPRREAIVRNAALADRLVGSFLDHVRSGELPLDEAVDLAALARSVAAQLQRRADELQVEAPPSLPVRRAKAVLIERVIGNLLDNAFAHGRPPVRLAVGACGAEVWIEVEDHGPGIAPEHRTTLLQAFARADSSRGRPGLGLGLSVVQRAATRLGGSVAFTEAADGRRHAVRVIWPLHPSDGATTEALR